MNAINESAQALWRSGKLLLSTTLCTTIWGVGCMRLGSVHDVQRQTSPADMSRVWQCILSCWNVPLTLSAMHAREICQYQRSTRLMIRKLPFQRLVKEILDRVSAGAVCCVQHGALEALQEAAEACLMCILPFTSDESFTPI